MTHIKQRIAQGSQSPLIPFTRKAIASHITSILFATATFGALAANSAYAQETTAVTSQTSAEQSKEETEVIEVTGIRFSQRSALDRKKQAGTMQDSLVAEDIGEFPDKNVAEALQRIPGIQLARDQGEGASVSIRGVDPQLLRVEVNSVGALGMGGSRAVDFRDMASELVKSLDVIKGSEARLTEGGIGGTIQVNTRKPNEFKEDFFSVSGEGQYNDLIGDVMPKFNLTGVHKFSDDFGVLLNVTGADKTTLTHALRNTEWARFADYDNSPEKTVVDPTFASVTDKADCATSSNQANCEAQWLDFNPYLPRYGMWQRQEERISANAMVQYAFNDMFSAHASYTYNMRDKTAKDINLQFETQSTARIKPESVVVDDLHNVRYFETANASISNRVLEFDWDQKSTQFETGFQFRNDAWRVEGVLARSTTDQDIDSRSVSAWAGGLVDMKVSLNDEGLSALDLTDAYIRNPDDLTDTSNKLDINDPYSYVGGTSFDYRPAKDESEETMGKVDVTYIPDSDFWVLLRSGYQRTEQKFANWNYRYDIDRNVGTAYNGVVWTIEDQAELLGGRMVETDEFFKGYDLSVDSLGSWLALDSPAVLEALQAVSADNTTREDLNVQNGNYDVSVKTQAVYLQANFESELMGFTYSGNFGIRAVETKNATNGNVRINVIVDELDENGDPIFNETTGTYPSRQVLPDEEHPDFFLGRKTIESDYTDYLPSFNLNVSLIPDELVFYVGVAKVMARPIITDMNVNATCTLRKNTQAQIDNTPDNCTAGNPALEPYRANQFDLALNWYPDEESIVSVAYFTKDITSWIIDPDTRFDVDFFGDGRLWDVRQKLNGSGVKTKGLEFQASTVFSMLPEPFNGLGATANYTYMEADNVGLFNRLTGEELEFPSQSKDSYNLTGFYENEKWSFKLSYNFRSEYLRNAADRSGNPAYVDDAGYLDSKLTYTVSPNLKVYADARNLTGEVYHVNAGPGRSSDLQWAGREYSVGFSYKL
ncbi:MAG: TonB-dependent receptor [Paraglaciecola sp.]|nr:TonB-dependent receptor [Paraglaciecola sp.]